MGIAHMPGALKGCNNLVMTAKVISQYTFHSSNVFRTYATDWRTGPATVYLDDGRKLSLSDVVIAW